MTCIAFLLSRANPEILVYFTDCKTKAQKGEGACSCNETKKIFFYQLAPAATDVEQAGNNLEVNF